MPLVYHGQMQMDAGAVVSDNKKQIVMKKILQVEWVDSSGVQGGWQFLEDFETELVRVSSVGYLVKETEELIALSTNLGERTVNSPEQINGVITIPKCAITSISSLKVSSYLGLELEQKRPQI